MSLKSSPSLLIFRDSALGAYQALSAGRRKQLVQQWNDWIDGLTAQGKFVEGHPLEPLGRVVSGPRGELVKDGPYAETKETVGGYFWLTVADIDEATEIAQGCPSLPLGLSVEVRPVAPTSPVLRELRARLRPSSQNRP